MFEWQQGFELFKKLSLKRGVSGFGSVGVKERHFFGSAVVIRPEVVTSLLLMAMNMHLYTRGKSAANGDEIECC